MKSLVLTILCPLFFFTALTGQIIYVNANSHGNGQSWEKATNNLSRALQVATPGTQIWVAAGTYFPSLCKHCTQSDRNESFKVPSGVAVYGGFAGNETTIQERKIRQNPTQLSGHIGSDDQFDNSRTVVLFENASNETILDGFTITGGLADNKEAGDGHASRSGGAIYNIATNENKSNPTIKNCLFFESAFSRFASAS